MATEPFRIYWDSCVFIDVVQKTPDRYSVLREIVRCAEAKELIIVTSAVAVAEVVRCEPDRAISDDDAKQILDFFENDYLAFRQLTRELGRKAAEISRMHGIKPLDAIHVATAIDARCQVMHTYDGRNRKKTRKLIAYSGKIGKPPLNIEEPSIPKALIHLQQQLSLLKESLEAEEREARKPPTQ